MNEHTKFSYVLDFEYLYKRWKYKLVFQKESNVFKYLSRDNKVLEYDEIIKFFELDKAEKQIMETLKEKWFYLIWEFQLIQEVPIHIVKFIIDNWLNPSENLYQIERTNKDKTLIYVKLWDPAKEWIRQKEINEHINNILKKSNDL